MTSRPLVVTLSWDEALRFTVQAGESQLVLDSSSQAGPSPVQALVAALAGCMAMDVVDILKKGRHPLTGLSATLTATRADEAPARLTQVDLQYLVSGPVPESAVQRAIQLSREKYCSVWHSLRQDIVFTTSFDIAE